MRIASCVGFVSYWGNDLPPDVLDRDDIKKTIGGGEEAALETALQLHQRGHHVDLWWYGQPGTWRGMTMYGLHDDLYGKLLSTDYDAVIAWSTLAPLEAVRRAGKRAKTFFAQQLNDLLNIGDWSVVDCIISPSANHAAQLPEWGWRRKPYAVVNNGIRPGRYKDAPAFNSRPLDVGYWSSPDRGLHHLLRAWPEVVRREPSARLHVFYEIERYLSFAQATPGPLGERARVLNAEIQKARAMPSVTFHGAVPRDVLAKTQVQCRVQCYPYQPVSYCEGFGTSVAQGIVAGCHVLLGPHDAFPSLYDGYVTWLDKDPVAMQEELVHAICHALRTPPVWEPCYFPYTWDHAGTQLERALTTTNLPLTNDGSWGAAL